MSAVIVPFNTFAPRRVSVAFAAGEDVTVTANYAPPPPSTIAAGTFTLVIQRQAGDGTALLTKAGTVADATAGTITFSITRADTLTLTPGPCVFRMQRTDSGNVTVGTVGQLNLLPPFGG